MPAGADADSVGRPAVLKLARAGMPDAGFGGLFVELASALAGKRTAAKAATVMPNRRAVRDQR
jgi:hypothetical protein